MLGISKEVSAMRVSELITNIENVPGTPSFRRSVMVKTKGNPPTKKTRIIYEPNEAMRRVHLLIRQWLRCQERFPHDMPRSPFENVFPHRDNCCFYQIDIWNAYGSVTMEMLFAAFRQMNITWGSWENRERLRTIIERHCMSQEGGLATGGPASTDLFNVVVAMLFDRRMKWFFRERGITYTRYVDDLTFSTSRDPLGARARGNILFHLAAAGFSVNHRKSVVCNNLAQKPALITGLKLGNEGRIYVPRQYLVKLRGMLHMAKQGVPVDWDMVKGYMGVFWSPFGGKIENPTLTKTERHILNLYAECLATRTSKKNQK